jgi:hypothetical protein
LLQKATPLPSLGISQLLGMIVALLVTEDTVYLLPVFVQEIEESLRV